MTHQDTKRPWTIGKKIFLLSGALLINILVVGGVGYFNTTRLVRQLRDISAIQLPAVRNMTLVDMMHDGLRAVALSAIVAGQTKDADAHKTAVEEFKEFSANIREYLDNLEKLDIQTATREAIAKSKPKLDGYITSTGKIIELAGADQVNAAIAKLPEFQKSFEELETELEALGGLLEVDAKHSEEAGEVITSQTTLWSIVLVTCGALIGFFLSVWIARSLLAELSVLARRLRGESDGVGSANASIYTASQNLSQSAVEQASALQETAASIEEISSMVRKSADNATRSREVSQNSHNLATQGEQAVQQMVQAIGEIDQSNEMIMRQVEESNRQIAEIVSVITEIGNKTKVINDIVFQTKLLSFNASVEAARAGEHGKGFAVVAEEVGNLAQMSGSAAKEISDMLAGGITKVETIVNETKSKVQGLITTGKDKVKMGMDVAHQCSALLKEVVENVSEVNIMASEIATAVNEQSLGISEITKAIHQLDQVTHGNATTAQQTATSSSQLSAQSQALLEVVGSLEKLVFSNPPNSQPSRGEPMSASAPVVAIPTAAESDSDQAPKLAA